MTDPQPPSLDLTEQWLRLWASFTAPVQSLAQNPITHAYLQQSNEAVSKAIQYWSENQAELDADSQEWLLGFTQLFSEIDPEKAEISQLQEAVSQSQQRLAARLSNLIDATKILTLKQKRLLHFNLRQLGALVDPRNSFCGNPDVMARAQKTEGQSLLAGTENYQQDLSVSRFGLQIRRSCDQGLELGKQIAATEGEVVYQNELIQLIHYRAVTDKQFQRPLLFVPPCINRYYILDLKPENSLVGWLLQQGLDVFMISWRNPDKSLASLAFDDYLQKGVLNAIEIASEISGFEKVNLAGYCIGGLMAALAAASNRGQKSVNSLSLLATLLDYSDPGELALFTTEEMLAAIDHQVEKQGLLDADLMSTVFTFLREEKLFWRYVRKQYFLGEKPASDALCYWGQDATHLPAKMAMDYLRGFYLDNQLVSRGGYQLGDERVEIRSSHCPKFVLGCDNDHIAPFPSVMASAELLEGEVFSLRASGGHAAGVINPASSACGHYQLVGNDEVHEGSWWPKWQSWLAELSGDKVKGKICAPAKYPSLEPAPGSFVQLPKPIDNKVIK